MTNEEVQLHKKTEMPTLWNELLPMPCFGFGLSGGGFWKGKVTGRSMTLYLTLSPSGAFSGNDRRIDILMKILEQR